MASTIAAITTGIGGIVTTADATGNLSLLSGTSTVVAVTSAGAAVTGTLTASTPIAATSGGTGLSAVGTAGNLLTSNGTIWTSAAAPAGGVTTFNGSTTGLTPATATSGAITLGGTLAVANGGTGVTTSTGSGANVLGTSPTLVTPNIGNASATTISMYGLITGQASTATDVNTANDTGALSCRSDGTATTVASMSFHRPGAYAINMGVGADNVFRIGGWSANNNCFQLDGSGNATILGNIKFNSGYGSVATAYGCRAWVNFNGTGTVAIRASGNVSSITDNGTGWYTVNFTTAMVDANYAVTGFGQYPSGAPVALVTQDNTTDVWTTTTVSVKTVNSTTSTVFDFAKVAISVIR